MNGERVPVARVRWVCPFNGTPVYCPTCRSTVPHRCELLAWGAVACPTHNVAMVRAPEVPA
jgi:hypothetical protein